MRPLNLDNPLDYSESLSEFNEGTINEFLLSLKPWSGGQWDSQTNKMKEYKKYLRSKLEQNQNCKCAYCGFTLKVTANPQIDHIAHKSNYPEYTFEKDNLVLACPACNMNPAKGEEDTICTKATSYATCTFLIVHPYFDNPAEHYEHAFKHVDGKFSFLCHKTIKGEWTITKLGLNSESRLQARYSEYHSIVVEDPNKRQRIEEILGYKLPI